MVRPVRTGPVRARPTDIDVRAVGLGSLVAAVTAWYAWQRYGSVRAGLFGLGLLLAVALFHARFGFLSA